MQKFQKGILKASGVIIITSVILSIGYWIKARSVISEMSTLETGEVCKNVFAIKDTFTNIYLIKDGDNYVAIDAGNKPGNIQEELKKLNIEPGKIRTVLLTHSDGDHVAGIGLFQNAGIYLSKQEEQMINGETSRFFIFGNKLGKQEYQLIDDQQILSIGNIKIQGFLTPGHTPGSMCYLVNDSLLFSGDALRLNNGKVEEFVGFLNMDSETAVRSIGQIIEIQKIKYIFTAHYGYSDNFSNAIKEWSLHF